MSGNEPTGADDRIGGPPTVGNADPASRLPWEDDLEAAGELTPAIVERITDRHGSRGVRAIEAVAEERVKVYLDFTVVVGNTEEYVVEEGKCHCEDSTYNLDDGDPVERCWHALSVEIARRVGALDHHDMWYSEVREFL